MKLDLGCGKNKKEGFIGVDTRQFDGVDVVCDLSSATWPWQDDTVEEVHCSHMLEHIPAKRATTVLDVDWLKHTAEAKEVVTYPRSHFFNELCRVLKKGGKATFITPYWASARAYGDPTHEWPPVCEFTWPYLNKAWRDVNSPHDDFVKCDFDFGYGYSLHQALLSRNPEYQQYALANFKEAAQDMICTLTKR